MSDPTHIPVWRRLDGELTTSGQPTEDDLKALSALGVEHVINLALHTHERALPDEGGSVTALGMTYSHIPVAFDAPTEGDFRRFCAAMESMAGAKVHVHCIVNARVSAFLYRYRRDVLGMAEQLARQEMESIWQPGGIWASFIADENAVGLPHRPGKAADSEARS
jgi:protein tyrosine phosphatase (PTP) superfamily phosphohydrolase (DUF442 family)